MEIGHPSTAEELGTREFRPGKARNWPLLRGKENAPDNYGVYLLEGMEGETRTHPRHHHNFDQVRYVMRGEYLIARNKVMKSGCVGYFPESTYYGPDARYPDHKILGMQFGGPSGLGYYSDRQTREAYEELVAQGCEFEDGMRVWTDEKGRRHRQDAFEAVHAQISHGEQAVYPKSRFDGMVLMSPENFAWIEDDRSPGVARKWLGSFTERQVRIGFVRLAANASLEFGTENAVEILFLKEGALSHGGQIHEEMTAFSSSTHDRPETLVALEPAELFYVKLPTFESVKPPYPERDVQ